MPITKSALKKQRADKAKTRENKIITSKVKTTAKAVEANPSKEALAKLYSSVDVAVKKHVLKLNTASRMKAKAVRAAKAKLAKSPFAK